MPRKKNANKLTSAVENYSAKDWDMETLVSYLIDYDENNLNFLYVQKIADSKPKQSHQARSAELRQQVRTTLAKLKGVDPKSILYPRSNDKLSEYNNEILHLKLEKSKETTGSLKIYEIEDTSGIKTIPQTAYKLSDDNEEQNQRRLSNVRIVDSESISKEPLCEEQSSEVKTKQRDVNSDSINEESLRKEQSSEVKTNQKDDSINEESLRKEQSSEVKTKQRDVNSDSINEETQCEESSKQIKKDYSVSCSDLAIVDISYREDKEGKAAFWDHYTFQRITKYPTRVVGTIDDASFLKEQIKDKTYGLPISSTSTNSYKPTPPIIGVHPYPPNDLHGLLLIPGSHADSNKCPNYEDRMKNEECLLRDARNRGRPVLGICDGGLKIWKLFGGKEVKVYNHADRVMPYLTKNGRVGHNTEMHHLRINLGSALADAMYGKEADKVAATYPVANSVHNKAMSSKIVPPNMKIVAWSIKRADKAPSNRTPEENAIEAAETCHGAPMFLIQWHPEAYNSDDTDGTYHRSILTYMAKAGDAYYQKQKMLLELKKLCQFPEGLIESVKKQSKAYQKTSEIHIVNKG